MSNVQCDTAKGTGKIVVEPDEDKENSKPDMDNNRARSRSRSRDRQRGDDRDNNDRMRGGRDNKDRMRGRAGDNKHIDKDIDKDINDKSMSDFVNHNGKEARDGDDMKDIFSSDSGTGTGGDHD
eukprot:752802_1